MDLTRQIGGRCVRVEITTPFFYIQSVEETKNSDKREVSVKSNLVIYKFQMENRLAA